MQLSIITAFDNNQLIGNGNQLPWNIPEDLAYFKKVTMGKTIVMGRKTFESIGRPLPKRRNIILSKHMQLQPKIEIISEYQQVLNIALSEPTYIIGGAEIYKLFLPFTTSLYITHIDKAFHGDTFFPTINWRNWTKTSETCGEDTSIKFCKYLRNSD